MDNFVDIVEEICLSTMLSDDGSSRKEHFRRNRFNYLRNLMSVIRFCQFDAEIRPISLYNWVVIYMFFIVCLFFFNVILGYRFLLTRLKMLDSDTHTYPSFNNIFVDPALKWATFFLHSCGFFNLTCIRHPTLSSDTLAHYIPILTWKRVLASSTKFPKCQTWLVYSLLITNYRSFHRAVCVMPMTYAIFGKINTIIIWK